MRKLNFLRIAKHMLSMHSQLKRSFPPASLDAIERAIKQCEANHLGEIRFVIESALDCAAVFADQTTRERAIEVFSQVGVWDTEHNNGVLIYVLLAEREVEIIADRGIYRKTGIDEWNQICHQIEAAFKQDRYEEGVIQGIQAVGMHLNTHYPASGENINELPDKPILL
ncbi:TPM domain-containing protein [Undibacterium sp. Ji42W]|uniref:TPM domain-containing protein n=1 Tax=Undibacterium sp. Ji42W TaxID=3413039 RepID=UPI003BF0A8E4